jgi:hypothetical protein
LPQLPEWPPEWPDIAWPVDPKPPRDVDDVEEDDEDDDGLVLLPLWSALLLDVKPTEVEFGGRPEDAVCLSRELDEPYQCQPREPDELEERLHGCCWTAGCAPGVTTPCCTAGCWLQFVFEGSI